MTATSSGLERPGQGRAESRGDRCGAPGVLYSPKGTWLRTSETGATVNALIPSDLRTDIERGACYNETFVDIAPI